MQQPCSRSDSSISWRSVGRHGVCALLLLVAACGSLWSVDFGVRDVPLFETEEWSFTDTSVAGEPFWHYGTVVFTHTESGATRTVTTYYDGDDTWRFRFQALRRGEWTFLSSGADPDQAGHSGTVQVIDPVAADKHGPIQVDGDRWVVQEADGGWRGIYYQVFQNGASDKDGNTDFPGLKFFSYLNKTEPEQIAQIENHLDIAEAHGFPAIFISVETWRDGSTGLPRLDTFRLFERLQERIWARNMHFHMWMWGDNGGGGDVVFMPDLYRYLAARIGALGSWSADRGYDTGGRIATSSQTGTSHSTWAESLQAQLAWPRPVGVRSQSSPYMSYISNDIFQNNLFEGESLAEYGYPEGRPLDPYHITRWMYDDLDLIDQPHIYMRRLWLGRSQLTTDETLHAIWGFMFGGGAAADLGFGEDGQQAFTRPERFVHIRRFLVDTERWRLDLEPVDGRSSAWMLSNAARTHTLLYQRDTGQITVDLSDAPSGLSAIAVNTEAASYTEIDLGDLGGSDHIIELPTTSHWAVAIGDFNDAYRLRHIDAGPDRFIRDTSGNGWAGVDLQAVPDPGLDDIVWTWDGGSAQGSKVRIGLPLGEHAITCSGVNPDGPDAEDTIYVRVVEDVDPGVVYLVGTSLAIEGEAFTIGDPVTADNSWSVKASSDKRGMATSAGALLDGDNSNDIPTAWPDARNASVILDVANDRSLQVYARLFGTPAERNFMVGLDGSLHGYGPTVGTFREYWHWFSIGGPLELPRGRHSLDVRHRWKMDLDRLVLGEPGAWPRLAGAGAITLTDEDGPGAVRAMIMQNLGDAVWDCVPAGTVSYPDGNTRIDHLDPTDDHTLTPVGGGSG